MGFKQLFILVEGDDDERFFEQIIKPKFGERYDSVKLWKYAPKRHEKIINFPKSIKSMGADYIYITDFNEAPCISGRKQRVEDKIQIIDKNRIVIVKPEIESWYLAGLNIKDCKHLAISHEESTDNITKERFNSIIPIKFDSRIDFTLEILKCFSLELAKRKNVSLKYFVEKYKFDC
jgi:hypothetical protein